MTASLIAAHVAPDHKMAAGHSKDGISPLKANGTVTVGGKPRQYPTPPQTGGVKETIHGIEINDPWRAFEELESDTTQNFIRAQNELSVPFLSSHPKRKQLEKAIERSYSHERTTCPKLQGDGYYYWLYNPGSAPRDLLLRSRQLERHYDKKSSASGDGPEIVFDPNTEDKISLYAYSWSPNGRYWCAILQESGSDWQKIRTIDTESKQVVEEDLNLAKFTFGATWIGDTGFLYKRVINGPGSEFSTADGNFGYYYHRLGTPQSTDVLIWRGNGPGASSQIVGRPRVLTSDEREGSGKPAWLYFDVYRNTNPEAETFVVDLPDNLSQREDVGDVIADLVFGHRRWVTRGYTGTTNYIGTLSDNTHIFESTADGVPTGRIVTLNINSNPIPSLTELVPANADGLVLQSANLIGDCVLAVKYLRHACAALVFIDARTGNPIGSTDRSGTRGHVATSPTTEIPVPTDELEHRMDHTESAVVIPKHASISSISSRSDSSEFYLSIDTFVAPPYVLSAQLHYEASGPEIKLAKLSKMKGDGPVEDLVCRQEFYESHDVVKIPLFICHAANLDMSVPQPTIIYAYGGSGFSIVPTHNPFFETFMRELGGVVAVANIRGGGEYGKKWHEAALGVNRAVSFDDFAYAAKYLHQKRVTVPSMTACYGISNGGLLVGANVNRHPDLWKVALPDVGVFDLTRFHKFTLGRLWTAEYGSPENPDQFPTIHRNSPLHNINRNPSVIYPAMLVTTGDHDTRVIPGHSLKYIAELQNAKAENENVFLCRVYEDAGHEAGSKTLTQKVEEAADRLVFLIKHLG